MRLQKELQGKTVFKKAKCCHNESVGFKYDQNVNNEVKLTTQEIQKADLLIGEITSTIFQGFESQYTPFRAPPEVLITRNLQVFYQVFRI